jgi:hypothetical protein
MYAASIAGTILLTECTIVAAPEDKKVGGFDPRFAEGISYDDDMFLHSLSKNNINIKIEDSQKKS